MERKQPGEVAAAAMVVEVTSTQHHLAAHRVYVCV
jgi:hypothetical protein